MDFSELLEINSTIYQWSFMSDNIKYLTQITCLEDELFSFLRFETYTFWELYAILARVSVL